MRLAKMTPQIGQTYPRIICDASDDIFFNPPVHLDFFNQKPHYHRLREKSHHKKQVLEDMSITIEEAKPDSMLKITEGMEKTKK